MNSIQLNASTFKRNERWSAKLALLMEKLARSANFSSQALHVGAVREPPLPHFRGVNGDLWHG